VGGVRGVLECVGGPLDGDKIILRDDQWEYHIERPAEPLWKMPTEGYFHADPGPERYDLGVYSRMHTRDGKEVLVWRGWRLMP